MIGTASATASNCASYTSCEQCLQHSEGCFWCATGSGACKSKTNELQSCAYVESHDLIYNATTCCSTARSYQECTDRSRLSFCAWAPQVKDPNVNGACMYIYDETAITKFADSPLERFAPCSVYRSCGECRASLVCGWCEDTSSCVPTDGSSTCSRLADTCCFDYQNCVDCFDQSGSSFETPQCVWVPSAKGAEAPNGGICESYKNIAQTTDKAFNRFGLEYCEDTCVAASTGCGSCVKASGCVWVTGVKWLSTDPTKPLPTALCVRGSLSGPRDTAIFFRAKKTDTAAITHPFTISAYYSTSCSIKGTQVIGLIAGSVVVFVVAIIATFIGISISKRVKYAKKLQQAKKENMVLSSPGREVSGSGLPLASPDDDGTAMDDEAPFLQKEVPWED